MIKGIESVPLGIRHMDRIAEFYTEELGFAKMFDTENGGRRMIMLAAGGTTTLLLFHLPFFVPKGMGRGIVLTCTDIEKIRESYSEKGIRCGGIGISAWGKTMTVKDPEGNELMLHEAW
jgi:catechol 2,3-dioxygenase-like lactoylglutathione lyase family enzyme